ncbi:MAG: MBL fold metallo-hydrolase [Candidatus Puniceispirillaceae bacterium]
MSLKIYGDGATRIGVRQISEKIFWIAHCAGKDAARLNRGFAEDFARINPKFDPHANDIIYCCYLFLDEKTFLIDTLGPAQHETMLEVLDDLLDGRTLDYLWISHTELPHAGNTAAIKRRHPDMTILTVSGHDHYEVHGLADAQKCDYGTKISLGEHEIEIIKPLFVDHALTQWIYEHKTGMLCAVDWALNAHNEHQCFRFMDEMEEVGYSAERFEHDVGITNCVVFPWLRWTNPDEIDQMIEAFYQTYDIRIFAPCHTNVIRKDTDKYMSALKGAMRKVITSDYDLVF